MFEGPWHDPRADGDFHDFGGRQLDSIDIGGPVG
jgi:hypothetical protein